MLANRIRQRPRTPQKNPAVPCIVPRRNKLLRHFPVGLLRKPLHPPHSNFRIHLRSIHRSNPARCSRNPSQAASAEPQAPRSSRRSQPAQYQRAPPPQTALHPSPHGPKERSQSPYPAPSSPAETPPARTPEQYSSPPARSRMCARGTSGSCSAISSSSSLFVITHTSPASSQRQQPLQRLLNHRPLAIQRQHLLRPRPPASRPEPCPTATRQNHRRKLLPRLTAFNRHTLHLNGKDRTRDCPMRSNHKIHT